MHDVAWTSFRSAKLFFSTTGWNTVCAIQNVIFFKFVKLRKLHLHTHRIWEICHGVPTFSIKSSDWTRFSRWFDSSQFDVQGAHISLWKTSIIVDQFLSTPNSITNIILVLKNANQFTFDGPNQYSQFILVLLIVIFPFPSEKMWFRIGRFRRKSIVFTIALLLICLCFYVATIKLVTLALDATR